MHKTQKMLAICLSHIQKKIIHTHGEEEKKEWLKRLFATWDFLLPFRFWNRNAIAKISLNWEWTHKNGFNIDDDIEQRVLR